MQEIDLLLFDEKESHKIIYIEYLLSGRDIERLRALCVLFHLSVKKAKSIIERIDAKKVTNE